MSTAGLLSPWWQQPMALAVAIGGLQSCSMERADPDLVAAMLARLEGSFRLASECAGTSLQQRLEQIVRDAARPEAPAWGSEGDAAIVRRRQAEGLAFLYRPHLFPGMAADLRIGHRVQYELLPTRLPPTSPVEIAALLESYCHLSGDVFGWRECADGALLMWLLDVSGHGVRAGFAAVVWKLLLEEVDPDQPLAALATRIERRFNELRNPADAGRLYATGVLLRIGADGRAEYLSAGHPPLLLRRADGAVEELGPTCLPLALLDIADRASTPFVLAPDEVVVLASDGVTDAGELAGEPFGRERLHSVVAAPVGALGELAEAIYLAVESHHDLDRLDDDLSFLLIRRRPGSR